MPSVFAEKVTIQLNCSNNDIIWDTFVWTGLPDQNFGLAEVREQDYVGNQFMARSYIMYNIASIPAGVTIDKVVFAKYSFVNDGNQDHDLQINNVYDNSWDGQTETTMTYNNQVCGTTIPFSDSDDCNLTYMDKITSASLQWDYFDVTPSIKYHYNQGNKNATFVVTTDETGISKYTYSYSKENNCGVDQIHYLNITYSTLSLNATLTIMKIVVNNDTCRLGPSNFTLKINETIAEQDVPIQLPPGVYNVNEISNPHYFATFYGDCDSKGNVILAQKQNKTCIIVNDDVTQAVINGMKFKDINGNGIKDINDTGLSTWRIYIDGNNNGFFDKNEKSALTLINGNYTLKDLDMGTYVIREVPKSGWTPTYPPEGKYVVTINRSGMIINNIDFGNRRTI